MDITFTYNGKEYTGEISRVQGAGDTAVYHLMIDNYYKGRLRLSAFDNSWVFDGEFTNLAEGLSIWLETIGWIKCEIDVNCRELFCFLIHNNEDAFKINI